MLPTKIDDVRTKNTYFMHSTCSLADNPLLSVASVGPAGGGGAGPVGGALEPFLTTCTSLVFSEPTVVEGFSGGWWVESGGGAMMN